jgi:hypothetical protein
MSTDNKQNNNKSDAFTTMMKSQASKDKSKPKANRKKHNPQKKLKTYFAPKTNSLGYPMKHCKFQPEEGAYMYQPPWYGQLYGKDPRTEGIPPVYCKSCKLGPCITREFENPMVLLGLFMQDNEHRPPAVVRVNIANRLERERRMVFKLDEDAPMTHTQCMTCFVQLWFPDVDKEESDDEL